MAPKEVREESALFSEGLTEIIGARSATTSQAEGHCTSQPALYEEVRS